MQLVGLYISPFVRRVGIALNVLGMPFEHVPASVVDGRDVIGRHNPLVRVPALVLDDGDVLVDSQQIVAEIDRIAGPGRALAPQLAASQRGHGQMIALLTGAMEKMVAAFYETTRRPADKIWPAWAEQCLAQAIGGITAAEVRAAASATAGDYLFENRLSHADIAAVLAIEMLHRASPAAVGAVPTLAALAGRLGNTAPFHSTRPT
jgi:glutathione S-transferase